MRYTQAWLPPRFPKSVLDCVRFALDPDDQPLQLGEDVLILAFENNLLNLAPITGKSFGQWIQELQASEEAGLNITNDVIRFATVKRKAWQRIENSGAHDFDWLNLERNPAGAGASTSGAAVNFEYNYTHDFIYNLGEARYFRSARFLDWIDPAHATLARSTLNFHLLLMNTPCCDKESEISDTSSLAPRQK